MSVALIHARLRKLRKKMKQCGVDAYLVPASDFHDSEYLGAHFKTREFLSGFTGSAGTLLVLPDRAGLWTDFRYFLQAQRELDGSGITLFRMREADVPTLEAFLFEQLPEGAALGFDGRTLSAAYCDTLRARLKERRVRFLEKLDLIGEIWQDRPPLPSAPAFLLSEEHAGRSSADKLAAVRLKMAELGADLHLLTALDDIAWLLNLRGGDVEYSPLLLSFLLLEKTRATLFAEEAKLSKQLRTSLNALGVSIAPYASVYDSMGACSPGTSVLLSTQRVNQTLCSTLLSAGATILDHPNPAAQMKACKNEAEQAGMRRAHLLDGIALTRMLFRLKHLSDSAPMTERSAAQMLNMLRLEQGALGPSFETIAGCGAHGAIVHYAATEETDVPLRPEGLLLLDSGGQYLCGTTDVTRTVALGPVSGEIKRQFTLVLRGMLQLSHAIFPRGTRSYQLDALARTPLWSAGLDYGHGTGHGVGCFLCVHEAPGGIRMHASPDSAADILEPGMVISDEPGVYVADSHGIRHENLLLCRPAGHEGYLCFETLTLAPFDRDAIDPELLGGECRAWLDAYHARVYDALSPHLSAREQAWLHKVTRPLLNPPL